MQIRLRPRFELHVDLTRDEVMELFREQKENSEAICGLELFEYQVEFRILKRDRHFWSPFLNLLVIPGDRPERQTIVVGKYGPNVNVWTMFLATYTVLGLCGLFGLIAGFSQVTIGQPGTLLGLPVVAAILAFILYGIGRIGRRLAHDQMVVFHELIESMFTGHVSKLVDEEFSSDD